MCGRFVRAAPPDEIARYFDAEPPETGLEPSYNVAPTDDVYVVRSDGSTRRVEPMHWGLVPHWAKDPSIGSKLINARAETLAEKNAFRSPLARRRCIIPADGFYEWLPVPGRKAKQPMFVHRDDDRPFAFAGLWSVWRDPNATRAERDAGGGTLHSCTIITGAPNEKVREVHDRMPVMLPEEAWETWLDPAIQDIELATRLLVPASPDHIEIYAVSTEVNDVRNEGVHLLDRVEPAAPGELPGQATLL